MIYGLMVGRNEEGRYLDDVMSRLSSQVDKIIFTDDCSTDSTPEIASKYATVYSTSENLFIKHEGQLRSEAWANLSKHARPGDWVVAVDADEKLYTLDNCSIEEVLRRSPYDVVNVKRYEMWNEDGYRVDKMWAPHNTMRIFRFSEGGVYLDKVLACGSEPTYVFDWVRKRNFWLESGIIMQHLGYLKDEDKQSKYNRYTTIDNGKFHNINHINSIKDETTVLIPWGIFGDKKVDLK